MECNKDEATRAKEIAENKFAAKDILGAMKFALKAQNLYPGLEGITQMLTTLDVYISAKNRINGEADWYGILGLDPLADDDTLRKQYRKLALMLHPDKNKSIGADGAFNLISEAWSLLSDKTKRVAYDEKINAKARKLSTIGGGSSAQKGANGSYNFTKTTTSSARTQKKTAKEHTSTPAHKSKSNTFWTVCHRCKVQYEYLRVYLNLKLLCHNCRKAFFAVETAPPTSGIRPGTFWKFSQDHQNSNHQVPGKSKSNAGKNMATPNVEAGSYSKTDSHNPTNFQWAPFSRTSGVSSAAQAANVVQQAYQKVKREREEAQAATKREEALQRKQHVAKNSYFNPAKRRRGMEDTSLSSHGKAPVNQTGVGNGVVGASNSCKSKQVNFESSRISGITKISSAKDVSQVELQNLLMEKAIKEICKKLRELQSNTVAETAVKESGKGYQKANDKGEKSLRNSETCDQNNIGKSEERMSGSQDIKSFAGSGMANRLTKALETMSIDVPDPDFHDFDKDRTERSLGENQVWAAYDNDDGMPRYYAMIHSVISVNPFKMQLSWLNPMTNAELGPLNLVALGFSKTCGDFRIGRSEISDSLNFFSHKVMWRKGTDGAIFIYPRKGDVWALYRNWSSNWNELTDYEVIHKYDMVEVLKDFSEEHGVIVTPLVKVAGFRTVFHRHLDLREIWVIPREEMFRFSHQVPSYLLTGQEAPNAPKGCWELDPAATPFDLLQVIKVVKEEVMVNNEDTIIKETADDKMKEANGEDMIDDMGKLGEEKEENKKDKQEIETMEEEKR